MIVGIGMDIIEIDRIAQAYKRHGASFLHKILAPHEIAWLPEQQESTRFTEYVAARFAAKEAAVKALGTGFTAGINFHSIIIASHPSGKPELILQHKAQEYATSLGVTSTRISITHTKNTAAAVVVLERA